MARRVRVEVLCDLCQAEDVETEAEETESIIIGNDKQPMMLGLCKQHWSLYEEFRDALREFGQPVPEDERRAAARAPKTPPSPETCKICGREYKYTGSLRTHVKDDHHMTLSEMRSSTGEPEPEPALAPKVITAICDVKGCTSGEGGGPMSYSWPEFARPAQSLGIHKRKAHDIAGTTKTSLKRAAAKAS